MGVLKPVQGLFGGRPGGRSGGTVAGSTAWPGTWGWGALSVLETPEEYAELRVAGGSGFGDPLKRPFEAVQRDLDAGYITAEGAERDYGCVVGADGVVDRAGERTPASRARGPRLRGRARPEARRGGLRRAEAAWIQRPASARPPSARAAR